MVRPPSEKPPRPRVFYGWWVVLVMTITSFMAVGPTGVSITVLVKPMAEEFDSSHAQLLGALTVAGVLSAVAVVIFGRLLDRHGGRVLVACSLIWGGVFVALISRAETLLQFYLFYSLGVGLGLPGVTLVSAPAIASKWFVRKRAIALSITQSALPASGIFFPLFAQAIVDWKDWREVWLWMGLGLLVVPLPLAWLVIRRVPEDMGLKPDGDPVQARPPTVDTDKGRRGSSIGVEKVSWTLSEALRTPTFWLLSGSLLLIRFPSVSLIIIMHPYFTDNGLSPGAAARLISFFAASAFLGVFLWGGLLQRWPVRSLLVPSAVSYGASIALVVAAGGGSQAALYLPLFVMGLALFGTAILETQVWADYYGRRHVGSILGVFSAIRVFPMAVGPLLAGLVYDYTDDYANVFFIFAVFCFIAVGGLLFAKPPRRKTSVPAT